MQFEKKVMVMNGSFYLPLTQDLVSYLELKTDSTMVIQDEVAKKGKFISAWKKKRG
jgi:hypothetical protein|tara:strand:- start:2006 stop:2173 length:168 start_codon:yes stop_codon:yes gene_type:complete